MISNLIIPVIVLGIIIYGFRKRVDIYDEFLVGVREGLEISLKLFPTIFSMILAINITYVNILIILFQKISLNLCWQIVMKNFY